ncbi:TPM domain-containing protein [Lutibacter sp. A80]|uniref:TPM domain-containing protein n=1 Tax=Lutibacter sp. A80 TaxID=2918453 RepID=UPI001F05648B|nr:TPM domain-containing protein [Lutibacter sp. A80]UMB59763.1 TPM domain-containing protein [Lutibacter sp. A80]
MSKVEDFLTTAQEQVLVDTIQVSEKNTSGEIRVHIEKFTEKSPMDRALEVFYLLEMDKTELRNGILIYVAVESKKIAILGDEGINNLVPTNFWDEELSLMLTHFKKGDFTKGLQLAIIEIGEKLKQFFPYQQNDINELSDEISKG